MYWQMQNLKIYLENIKNDSFYSGIIEISLLINIFHKTIIVYSIEEQNDNDNDNDESNGINPYLEYKQIKTVIMKKAQQIQKIKLNQKYIFI